MDLVVVVPTTLLLLFLLAVVPDLGLSARARRVLGYVCAGSVGVVVGVVLGFMALVTGLCNNAMAGPDGCTAQDEAQMQRYGVAAVVSPVAAIGVYALIEVSLHRQRSRRMTKS